MSQSFAGVAVNNYVGKLFTLPLGWGQKLPNRMDPSITLITIPWNIYWQLAGQAQQAGVAINLQSNSVYSGIIDRIETVKIDNTGNVSPITVIFPDTLDAVTCPANTIIIAPAFTNGNQAVVYAQGLEAGFIGSTQIAFANRVIPPSYDPNQIMNLPQHVGSQIVQRNFTQLVTPGYGPPALGDQADTHFLSWTSIGQLATLWGTPRVDFSFIYLTNIFINAISLNSPGAGAAIQLLQSTGAAGILFGWEVGFGPPGTSQSYTLMEMNGCNLKLDASQTWEINESFLTGTVGGFVSYNFAFSVND